MENKVADVPYIVHEAEMARMERMNKRWFWAWLLTFVLLVGCVTGFLWYEAQFEEVTLTQEADTGGGGNVILNGVGLGDLYYGESETDSKSPAA